MTYRRDASNYAAAAAVPVVIGSLLHGAEIAAAIAARGLTNPIVRLDPSAP